MLQAFLPPLSLSLDRSVEVTLVVFLELRRSGSRAERLLQTLHHKKHSNLRKQTSTSSLENSSWAHVSGFWGCLCWTRSSALRACKLPWNMEIHPCQYMWRSVIRRLHGPKEKLIFFPPYSLNTAAVCAAQGPLQGSWSHNYEASDIMGIKKSQRNTEIKGNAEFPVETKDLTNKTTENTKKNPEIYWIH